MIRATLFETVSIYILMEPFWVDEEDAGWTCFPKVGRKPVGLLIEEILSLRLRRSQLVSSALVQ